ncbi:hypothetical protein ACOMHN_064685 [Nucella lapillus]
MFPPPFLDPQRASSVNSTGTGCDPALSVYCPVMWLMVICCSGGVLLNSLSLYILFLSFTMKEGCPWLTVVAVCDLVECICVLPFEIYGVSHISTVDISEGVCFLITVADAWITCLVAFANYSAVLNIFARHFFPQLPKLNRQSLSRIMGVELVTSMAISFLTLTARSSGGYLIYANLKDFPTSHRATCMFRDGMFLEHLSNAADVFIVLRMVFLLLLAVLTCVATAVSYRTQARQNGVDVLHEFHWHSEEDCNRGDALVPAIDEVRLMQSVDNVVRDPVSINIEHNELTRHVEDILTADKALVEKVLDLYFSGDHVSFDFPAASLTPQPSRLKSALNLIGSFPSRGSVQNTTQTQDISLDMSRHKQFDLGDVSETAAARNPRGLARSNPAISSSGRASKVSFQNRPIRFSEGRFGGPHVTVSGARRVPAGNRLSVASQQAAGHVLARRSISQPNMSSDLYFQGCTSLDAYVHSALTYLKASEKVQLSLRKEMIFQHALSRMKMRRTVTSTHDVVHQQIWSEVYFLHFTLKPLLYFIFVAKFRSRFFFLFCRSLHNRWW